MDVPVSKFRPFRPTEMAVTANAHAIINTLRYHPRSEVGVSLPYKPHL